MANLVIISALLNGSLWPSIGTELQLPSPGLSNRRRRLSESTGQVDLSSVIEWPRRVHAGLHRALAAPLRGGGDWRSVGRTARANVTDDALASFGLGRLALLPGSLLVAARVVMNVLAPSRLRARLRHDAVGRYLHLRFHHSAPPPGLIRGLSMEDKENCCACCGAIHGKLQCKACDQLHPASESFRPARVKLGASVGQRRDVLGFSALSLA